MDQLPTNIKPGSIVLDNCKIIGDGCVILFDPPANGETLLIRNMTFYGTGHKWENPAARHSTP